MKKEFSKNATQGSVRGQPDRPHGGARARAAPVRCDSSPDMRFIRYSPGPFLHGVETDHSERLESRAGPGLFAQMTASSASPPAGNGPAGRWTARSKRSSRWKRIPTRARPPRSTAWRWLRRSMGRPRAAEDALHRQADHGHQLADPLLPGEGQHLAEDDAGEFADAVLQARPGRRRWRGGSAPTSLPRGGLRQRGRWGRCWAACNPGRN